MARLTRQIQKVFCLNASTTNVGQFGSGQLGTKNTTKDIATIQALTAWLDGWTEATISGNKLPPLEEFNGFQYVVTYNLAYLFQEGIPEWQTDTTYYIDSVVKKSSSTQLYKSIVDDNTGNALTDNTKWAFLMDLNLFTRTTFNNANLVGVSTDRYVAQVGTMSAPRTYTLPAVSAVNPGYEITIQDESGTVTSSNTIVIARAGSDTINGGTSFTIGKAYGGVKLISNGTSAWSVNASNLRAENNLSDILSASTARTNLGLAIGTNVQAYNDLLTAIAALSSNGIIVRTASNTASARSVAGSGLASASNGDGVSGNPTITVTAATQSDQETGTSTTTVVTPERQQYHPSASKAWVSYNGSTVAINASYNVTSITKNATGNYTVNLTTAFSSANFAAVGSHSSNTGNISSCATNAVSSSTITQLTGANGALTDPNIVNCLAFGDQ